MKINDFFNEEKTRLDPACWTGKKIGTPKTKVKGGVRVNNCVPAESIAESKERCKQCGMTNCSCKPGTCKCKPIKGWIPNKGFDKAIDEAKSAHPQQAAIAIAKKKKAGVAEDAVTDFVTRGGQIQQGKLHKPRKGETWQGSSHIGAAGGTGTKGTVSGKAANTNPKSSKPVVTAEQWEPVKKEPGVAEELSLKHQRDHSTQHYPDTSNSLATRSVGQAELPNVYKTADGHPTVRGRFHGKAAQTRVNPTITPTSVNRKDSSGPIPAFLKKGVAEEITADDMAQSAHAQGLKHGREGSGNNMDRAKAQHGENFKHYNAGFLKGRNEKAKRLKVVGQGYNKKRPQPVAEEFNGEYDDEAGMADNNLETLRRAVDGIDNVINTGDNLPEWCQEKIAVAKSMLVTVWDYMRSEEQIEDPEIAEMYEAMQLMAESMAHKHRVSVDLVWESFEALDDHMLYETAAWRRKEGKSAKGGLNAKGVASYRRENPGSKLQTAVTTKPSKLKPGSKAAKRRKSFCARMSGVKGPAKKPNGKPTRKTLALRKWNC